MKDLEFPLIGDIILVTSLGKKSLSNRIWQRLLCREKIAFRDIPSHVAICRRGTDILHALTDGGSQISPLAHFFNDREYKDNIRVYRSIELEKGIKAKSFAEDFLIEKIEKHWGEPYNFGVIAREEINGRKFCSEVVTIFLQDIGILNETYYPSRVFPIHLMQICQDGLKWREVTDAYKALLSVSFIKDEFEAFKINTDNTEVHRDIDLMVEQLVTNVEYIKQISTFGAELEEAFKMYDKRGKELDKKIEQLANIIDLKLRIE